MRIIIFLLSVTLLFTPLVSAKEKGNIKVYCDKGFKISLDGEYKGEGKRKKKSVLIEDVLYGKHIIEFVKKGFVHDTIHVSLHDSIIKIDLNKIISDKNILAIKACSKSVKMKYDRDEYFRIMKLDVDSTIPKIEKSTDYLIQYVLPLLIKDFKPIYPEILMKSEKTGTVWITALVGPDGNVIKVKVGKKSKYTEFDEAAKMVAYKYLFIPAVYENKRIAAWVTYKVVFSLSH